MNLTNINQQAYSSPTATHLAVGFDSLKIQGASAPLGLCAFFMQKIINMTVIFHLIKVAETDCEPIYLLTGGAV